MPTGPQLAPPVQLLEPEADAEPTPQPEPPPPARAPAAGWSWGWGFTTGVVSGIAVMFLVGVAAYLAAPTLFASLAPANTGNGGEQGKNDDPRGGTEDRGTKDGKNPPHPDAIPKAEHDRAMAKAAEELKRANDARTAAETDRDEAVTAREKAEKAVKDEFARGVKEGESKQHVDLEKTRREVKGLLGGVKVVFPEFNPKVDSGVLEKPEEIAKDVRRLFGEQAKREITYWGDLQDCREHAKKNVRYYEQSLLTGELFADLNKQIEKSPFEPEKQKARERLKKGEEAEKDAKEQIRKCAAVAERSQVPDTRESALLLKKWNEGLLNQKEGMKVNVPKPPEK